MKVAVCALDDLQVDLPRAVSAGRHSLVLVRTRDGAIYALNDRCPHHGARLSFGPVLERVDACGRDYALRAGEYVLRCPWHSYEFELATGRCLVDPARMRVRTYPVDVRDGQVYVSLGRTSGPAEPVEAAQRIARAFGGEPIPPSTFSGADVNSMS